MKRRGRLLVVGLGDAGLLTAIHLARDFETVAISSKPGLVSGQELGLRLSRPDVWALDYRIDYRRFRGLDRVRIVHGSVVGLDADGHRVSGVTAEGGRFVEPFDILVIATGVTNGFWRTATTESDDEITTGLNAAHARIADAHTVAVIGGGAAGISSAVSIATVWPDKRVDLYFPGDRPLAYHHRRTWDRIRRRIDDLGIGVHPGHRAIIPDGFAGEAITDGPIEWSTGQPAAAADAVLWAIGAVRPNTSWVPPDMLDAVGFVRVNAHLQVPNHPEVFAIGDVAATDALRSSARNRADRLLAHNIRAFQAGRRMRSYRPPSRRWGSVLGVQPDGLEVFTPTGRVFCFPGWSINTVLQPWIVRRGIYHGIRDA